MKQGHIPMAGDAIPTKRKNDSECPYPINESITSIEPPSYNSIINDETSQGPGCSVNGNQSSARPSVSSWHSVDIPVIFALCVAVLPG